MQKKLALLSIFTLCLFACGCNNSEDTDTEIQCENSENGCLDEVVENIEVENGPAELAEKLEGEDQITVSEGGLDSESVAEVETFESPIE